MTIAPGAKKKENDCGQTDSNCVTMPKGLGVQKPLIAETVEASWDLRAE